MAHYNAPETEKKWQKQWDESQLYKSDFDSDKPKYYNLVMFPYPSGDTLHVGHWYNYAPPDSWGRYMRMKGFQVFEPFGYDSFGLPAENYAIKTGVNPDDSTNENIATMTRQMKEMGCMYDWDTSLATSQADYYRWTQWLFLQLYKKGLAYKKLAPVNWCPKDQTVLANEQVVDGHCERCGTEVTKKNLSQWFFKIRDYAEKLLNFEGLDWPEKTKLMQQHWIGRSEGSELIFQVDGCDEKIAVFTTRADTLFGCTYMVLAPEHPLVLDLTTPENKAAVEEYMEKAKHKNDIERSAEGKEKNGAFTGSYAINPATGEKVPVWIADYVLMTYGTGAVMAVPAHDDRDFEFAKKYDLPIKTVIVEKASNEKNLEQAFTAYGILVNSGEFSELSSEEARKKITLWLEEKGLGKLTINYKLRDWLVSRQRYWGAPIPVLYDENDEAVAVDEADLPVVLPRDVDFVPKGDGKSPLNSVAEFVNVEYKGKKMRREVDTMDTFVDSSWYFLRYPTAKLDSAPFDKEVVAKMLPVDMYVGGAEHACMHLLYARFINMFLYDHGYITNKEPFKRLIHQGFITRNGAKMSKSKGNVVSPDEYVSKYGSDIFRMYLMFMGPFTEGGDWNDQGITGVARFANRFYTLMTSESAVSDEAAMRRAVHKAIKKVSQDIERFNFNTCIAALMEFMNEAVKTGVDKENKQLITRLIAPFAPHLAEEIWGHLGEKDSVFNSTWPAFNPEFIHEDSVNLAVQVNGKVRGEIRVAKELAQEEILALAKAELGVAKYLAEGKLVKEIYVKEKLVSFVVK